MSTCSVYGYVVTPGGYGIENAKVVAHLSGVGPPYFLSGYIMPHANSYTTTDRSGYFSLTLYPNSEILPAGTVYDISINRGLLADSTMYTASGPLKKVTVTNVIVPVADRARLVDLIGGA